MSDIGDEIGSDLQQKSNTLLMSALRHFAYSMRSTRTQAADGRMSVSLAGDELDAVRKALDAAGIDYELSRQTLASDQARQTTSRAELMISAEDADRASQVVSDALRDYHTQPEPPSEASQPSRDPLPEQPATLTPDGGVSVVMPSVPQRDAMAQALDREGIPYSLGSMPSIVVQQSDLERIRSLVQHETGMEFPIPESARMAPETIRSHDGMDIDPHSTVVESSGYDYKDDIAQKVAAARDASVNEDMFIDRCRESGIDVNRAADGDYLFHYANEAAAPDRSWHPPVKAATLGEEYTRKNTFSPGEDLERAQHEMLDSARQQQLERGSRGLDREVQAHQVKTK